MVVKTVKTLAVVFIASSAIATLYPSPVRALESGVSIRSDVGQSLWNDITVDPQNPLTLLGEGAVRAYGAGDAEVYVRDGELKTGGIGVVGIKTSHDSVDTIGWSGGQTVGDWKFFWGEGGVKVNGDDYQMISFLMPGRVEFKGLGSSSFEGDWKVRFNGFTKNAFEKVVNILVPKWLKDKVQK